MKIGIYQEPSSGIGGSEYVTAVMAHALSRIGHDVDIVHHHSYRKFSVPYLADFFSIDLAGVHDRRVPVPDGHMMWSGWPGSMQERRYRQWESDLSRRYELFVANVHGAPPRCHAKSGILHILFPMFDPHTTGPLAWPVRGGVRGILDQYRQLRSRRRWRKALASYSVPLAISQFAAYWTQRMWNLPCHVLYPPSEAVVSIEPKQNSIVTLARFSSSKQQDLILNEFLKSIEPVSPSWELVFIGSTSDQPDDAAFLSRLQSLAAGHRVRFIVNAARESVLAELGRTKVLWHTMGVGINPETQPYFIEHYGIAVVEAMSAGCIPVVLNCGGPSEIVTDGVCGFACGDLAGMARRILELTRSDSINQMANTARERAKSLSRERFEAEFLQHIQAALVQPSSPLVRESSAEI